MRPPVIVYADLTSRTCTRAAMELIEIRDLDGPNLYLLRPVLAITFATDSGEVVSEAARKQAQVVLGVPLPAEHREAAKLLVQALHERAGLPVPATGQRPLDIPGHETVYFTWERRALALAIAGCAWDALAGNLTSDPVERLRAVEPDEDDAPLWVRDAQRRIPAVGITGTNGKTTTTRLLAHIVRQSGRRAGWSSSTGVYIDGAQVLAGDYTGPTGARRVLDDPTVDVAVLETARGGILLRGLAYESNDVGVLINVSADHLGMHGVTRVETLADVKSVVVRVTRPDGLVVLNADDELVLRQRDHVRAPVLLFSQQPDRNEVREHLAAGGAALVRAQSEMVYRVGDRSQVVANFADVPMTFGGSARHMVENALAAAGAASGLGISFEAIARGLQTFRNDPTTNPGRLNVFRLDGRTVVVDYAHNESGLRELLAFTRGLMGDGNLIAIIGTAGDRQDEVLRSLGQIAAVASDRVYLKENPHYLRGREAGAATQLMQEGLEAAGAAAKLAGDAPGEHAALLAALDDSRPGDAIAIMCVEDQVQVIQELRGRGADEGGG